VQDTASNAQDSWESGDDASQQMLAADVAQPEPQDGEDQAAQNDPWADPSAARKEIEKLRRESAGYRTKLRDAEPQLAEYQKYLDSQKTEQQKLLEAKEATERELLDLRSTNARLLAATTYNLPTDLIDLLGTGTDEEINARAQLLAEKLASVPTTELPASTRPVESLTAGGRPADDAPADMSMDAVLRRMTGR
jgi:chromosome segregation ATPase